MSLSITLTVIPSKNTRSTHLPIPKERPNILDQQVRRIQRGKMPTPLMHSSAHNIATSLRPVQWRSVMEIKRELGDGDWLRDIGKGIFKKPFGRNNPILATPKISIGTLSKASPETLGRKR